MPSAAAGRTSASFAEFSKDDQRPIINEGTCGQIADDVCNGGTDVGTRVPREMQTLSENPRRVVVLEGRCQERVDDYLLIRGGTLPLGRRSIDVANGHVDEFGVFVQRSRSAERDEETSGVAKVIVSTGKWWARRPSATCSNNAGLRG